MTERKGYKTPKAQEIAKEAKQLAKDQGQDWNALSAEERREFKRRVREAGKGR